MDENVIVTENKQWKDSENTRSTGPKPVRVYKALWISAFATEIITHTATSHSCDFSSRHFNLGTARLKNSHTQNYFAYGQIREKIIN